MGNNCINICIANKNPNNLLREISEDEEDNSINDDDKTPSNLKPKTIYNLQLGENSQIKREKVIRYLKKQTIQEKQSRILRHKTKSSFKKYLTQAEGQGDKDEKEKNLLRNGKQLSEYSIISTSIKDNSEKEEEINENLDLHRKFKSGEMIEFHNDKLSNTSDHEDILLTREIVRKQMLNEQNFNATNDFSIYDDKPNQQIDSINHRKKEDFNVSFNNNFFSMGRHGNTSLIDMEFNEYDAHSGKFRMEDETLNKNCLAILLEIPYMTLANKETLRKTYPEINPILTISFNEEKEEEKIFFVRKMDRKTIEKREKENYLNFIPIMRKQDVPKVHA